MTIKSSLVLVVMAVALPGCASRDWLAYGYDHRHFSRQPNESALTASAVGTLHVNFDFAIPGGAAGGGSEHSFTASPSVYNDVVYVGGLNGIFYAIYATGASKGTVKWRYPPATAAAPDSCAVTTQSLPIPTRTPNPSPPPIPPPPPLPPR